MLYTALSVCRMLVLKGMGRKIFAGTLKDESIMWHHPSFCLCSTFPLRVPSCNLAQADDQISEVFKMFWADRSNSFPHLLTRWFNHRPLCFWHIPKCFDASESPRYLLLAVWLSMHASICSHSFGVRLLTRFAPGYGRIVWGWPE